MVEEVLPPVEVILELEYYSDDRLQKVLNILEENDFIVNNAFERMEHPRNTTIFVWGFVDDAKRDVISETKDFVRLWTPEEITKRFPAKPRIKAGGKPAFYLIY